MLVHLLLHFLLGIAYGKYFAVFGYVILALWNKDIIEYAVRLCVCRRKIFAFVVVSRYVAAVVIILINTVVSVYV